jgi:hypothetical protein
MMAQRPLGGIDPGLNTSTSRTLAAFPLLPRSAPTGETDDGTRTEPIRRRGWLCSPAPACVCSSLRAAPSSSPDRVASVAEVVGCVAQRRWRFAGHHYAPVVEGRRRPRAAPRHPSSSFTSRSMDSWPAEEMAAGAARVLRPGRLLRRARHGDPDAGTSPLLLVLLLYVSRWKPPTLTSFSGAQGLGSRWGRGLCSWGTATAVRLCSQSRYLPWLL